MIYHYVKEQGFLSNVINRLIHFSGTVGAVRVMRVEYDHYSKMCRSNKIPPQASKDQSTYVEQVHEL